MADQQPTLVFQNSEGAFTLKSLRKSLGALAAGERRNQIYYLTASMAGVGVGAALIWWSWIAHLERAGFSAAIPLIASALSVTRIAACELKIAQYKAAAELSNCGLAIELLKNRILTRGVERAGG